MFDIQATIRWVTAVLTDPGNAAASYKEGGAVAWKQSFMQIVLPVYVAASVFGYLLALITGGSFFYGRASFGFFLFSLVWSLGWTFVIAFIFDYLAGMFEGSRNFDNAYSVVALAIIPAALGAGLAPLPWIGWLISLAASLYSLMLAYRFIPLFLALPEASRVKHFAVSIIAAVVVNILVSVTVGSAFAPAIISNQSGSGSGSGMFGDLERHAGIAEQASRDVYDPPSSGELSRSQVEAYVAAMKKTAELRGRLSKKFEGLDEDNVSMSDVFGGVSDAVRLQTAEMEVVKGAGGNWAEHLWVKNQLEIARVQQDINDAVKHNYQLFLKYQDDIEQYE